MTEWWTYRLSSFLLFSPRTYFRLHELYNIEVWPLQLAGLVIAVVIIAMALRAPSGRAVAGLLAVTWLFVAFAYHLRRYSTINWAATYFAAAFAVQAILLLWTGTVRHRLVFASQGAARRRIGFLLLLFGVFVQPAAALLAGRSLLQSEYFGVAPDPTVTATLGVLLLANRSPWTLWIVPLLWCAVSAAFQSMMRSPDALILPVVGVIAVACAIAGRRPAERARAR
ncbi:MAG TPA: DUF6064 family protein [Casimicrobiaceae bacterium]|nr:DUF6064 family protein [Casimicrobiaceae bacterium]